MIYHAHTKAEYLHCADVEKLVHKPNEDLKLKFVDLFGKQIELYDDPWMWHLHLKVTDVCNAHCAFCVEQNCTRNENAKHFIENLDKMLSEMEAAGILYSVSVTGGEPTLFKQFVEMCAVLKKHNIKFLTMNTNGYGLKKHHDVIDGLFDWVNVSRHRMTDEENFEIFKTTSIPTIADLKEIRDSFKHTKMRIQCVMDYVNTPERMMEFANVFSFADDISFRRLMKLGTEFGVNYKVDEDEYITCLEWCFKNLKLVEQTIQDYYVYEIYEMPNGKNVTFSYSNMKMLRELEHVESESKIREFIIHPNGLVSGSWKMDTKIILK